jgi:hypothetical protein
VMTEQKAKVTQQQAERVLARPERESGEDGALWLGKALRAVGARRVRHPGNLRYLFALGNRRERRAAWTPMPSLPYPKDEARAV